MIAVADKLGKWPSEVEERPLNEFADLLAFYNIRYKEEMKQNKRAASKKPRR